MKLISTKMKGFSTAFSGVVEIDWQALGPGLIAVTGDNEAGKTTLLEAAIFGVLYRRFPSYGERIAEKVQPGVRDAFIETTFEIGGHTYRALVECDPEFSGGKGKTECRMFVDGGTKPIAGPLQADFDAFVEKNICPEDLFLAAPFACQGGDGSILKATKGERKKLFSQRLLGSTKREAMAGKVKEMLATSSANLSKLDDDLARANGAATMMVSIEAELASLVSAIEKASADYEAIEYAVGLGEFRVAEASAREDGLAKMQADRLSHEELLESVCAMIQSAQEKLQNADKARAWLTENQVDESTKPALEKRITSLGGEVAKLDAEIQALITAKSELDFLANQLEISCAKKVELACAVDAHGRGDSATTKHGIESTVNEITSKRKQLDDLRRQLDEYTDKRNQLQLLEREFTNQRIQAERAATSLSGVDEANPICIVCPLAKDAIQSKAAYDEDKHADLLGELAETSSKRNSIKCDIADLESKISGLESTLILLNDQLEYNKHGEALREKLAEAIALCKEIERRISTLDKPEVIESTLAAKVEDRSRIADSLSRARGELAALDTRIEYAKSQESIASHVDVLRVELIGLNLRKKSIEEQLEQSENVDAQLEEVRRYLDSVRDSYDTSRNALAEMQQRLGELELEKARLEGTLQPLRNASSNLGNLSQKRQDEAMRGEALALLAKGLGNDGITALEVSVIGPVVADIANSILSDSALGSRYRIAIETLAEKADGGYKEVFDVRLIDTQAERNGSKTSGGATVIFDEALRLAIAIYNSQSCGRELLTLVRDETAGMLSEENASDYVSLLRRAIDIGGFHQVLFVAHQRSVWEQADAVIRIESGEIKRVK